jgi:ketosteroid isomerase-like protein
MRSANSVRRLYIGCALLLLASAAPPGALAQSGSDAVEQVIKDFLVPFSNRNIREFIEYFADEATVFFPSVQGPGFPAERVQGKAAIAREFEAAYQRVGAVAGAGSTIIQPLDLMVQRFDDFAVVTFHLGTDAARNRRTFVLRRIEARWRIVHLHASSFAR